MVIIRRFEHFGFDLEPELVISALYLFAESTDLFDGFAIVHQIDFVKHSGVDPWGNSDGKI